MKNRNPEQQQRSFATWLAGLAAIVGAAASLTANPHVHAADLPCPLHPQLAATQQEPI